MADVYHPDPLAARLKRSADLLHLLEVYACGDDNKPHDAPVWESWLAQSGELPPDFDRLPTCAPLPALLCFTDGSAVAAAQDWPRRRREVLEILEHYQLGIAPPPPQMAGAHMAVVDVDTIHDAQLPGTVRRVRLIYGPNAQAVAATQSVPYYDDPCMYRVVRLNIELFIPDGPGPFPAVVEVGNHPSDHLADTMALRSARRDYVVCLFNGAEAFTAQHVFAQSWITELGWWAYAASRCIDYLSGLDFVDAAKIAVQGHSRGAKMALIAAALDARVAAAIASHTGTGAGSAAPWRYAGEKHGAETLESSTRSYPYWNHPRLRFFAGRENKLPFDSHFMLALVAPRPLLVTEGDADDVGEAWGTQQAYLVAKQVYALLGHSDRLNLRFHSGGHRLARESLDQYMQWLDMQFGLRPHETWDERMYTYSFDGWRQVTGATVDVSRFPERGLDDLLTGAAGAPIGTPAEWQDKRAGILDRMLWVLGDLPERTPIPAAARGAGEQRQAGRIVSEFPVSDTLIARLTYPAGAGSASAPLPVVIFLHAYVDALGARSTDEYGWSPLVGERLADRGFLAVEFDQFGYGRRNHDCGLDFYARHPQQSALGVMVQDVRSLIDALAQVEIADTTRVMVAGYSLGGAVALHAAALDPRIKAVASTCGFGSMRLDAHGDATEGLRRYTHLRPTLPRLGFFVGEERRVPYDFHEVLALIAPRPVFVVAPQLDQDWDPEDVMACCRAAASVYQFLGAADRLQIATPYDFNRYPPHYQAMVNDWLVQQAGAG